MMNVSVKNEGNQNICSLFSHMYMVNCNNFKIKCSIVLILELIFIFFHHIKNYNNQNSNFEIMQKRYIKTKPNKPNILYFQLLF